MAIAQWTVLPNRPNSLQDLLDRRARAAAANLHGSITSGEGLSRFGPRPSAAADLLEVPSLFVNSELNNQK